MEIQAACLSPMAREHQGDALPAPGPAALRAYPRASPTELCSLNLREGPADFYFRFTPELRQSTARRLPSRGPTSAHPTRVRTHVPQPAGSGRRRRKERPGPFGLGSERGHLCRWDSRAAVKATGRSDAGRSHAPAETRVHAGSLKSNNMSKATPRPSCLHLIRSDAPDTGDYVWEQTEAEAVFAEEGERAGTQAPVPRPLLCCPAFSVCGSLTRLQREA